MKLAFVKGGCRHPLTPRHIRLRIRVLATPRNTCLIQRNILSCLYEWKTLARKKTPAKHAQRGLEDVP